MTIITTPAARSRATSIAAHVYETPVVQELPPRPVDGPGSGTW